MAVETSAGNTGRNKALQSNEKGIVPNLWGVSPVGRDEGDRSYMTQMISRGT